MTWMAPWALLGLLAVAAPVLVHWLARHQAKRLRFPTIQFLTRTSPVSVRRYRLRDKRLLVVRMAIIVAAVLALAQPVWVRPGAPAAQPARAVVLDTSASLRRTLADGRVGADVARETATAALSFENDLRGPTSSQSRPLRSFSNPDAPSVTIATDRVSEGVAQAAAWLAKQAPPRELVVVSDFQVGALVESDLDTVPEDADVRLVPIAVTGPVPAPPVPARGTLRVVVGQEQAARASAAEAAARELGGDLPQMASEPIAVVFPSAPNRAELQRVAQPLDTPELFGWVADIRQELERLGQTNELGGDFRKIASELTIFTDVDPGSEQAAALMAAILRAAAPPALPIAEREPDTLAPATLEGWQRVATPSSSAIRVGERSDGRWFWLVALILFVVEAFMRRRPV